MPPLSRKLFQLEVKNIHFFKEWNGTHFYDKDHIFFFTVKKKKYNSINKVSLKDKKKTNLKLLSASL